MANPQPPPWVDATLTVDPGAVQVRGRITAVAVEVIPGTLKAHMRLDLIVDTAAAETFIHAVPLRRWRKSRGRQTNP